MTALALIGAGIAVCTGIGAGIGIGVATGHATQAMARQPEMTNQIRATWLVGLAFAESTAIYGLVIAILLLIK